MINFSSARKLNIFTGNFKTMPIVMSYEVKWLALLLNFWDWSDFSPALAKESLVHSYGRSFNGFVARLSDKEAAKIRGDSMLW